MTVGIIGAGHIARRYVASMQRLEPSPCHLVGIADIDPCRACALGESAGVPAFDSAAGLLAGCDPDMVVVATPPVRHADDMVFCIEQGVHVLCEKPFVTCAADLRRVLEVHARRGDLALRMASQYRYAAGVQRALALVEEGAIGPVLEVHVVFTHPVDMSGRWHADPRISGGGVLMDNGSHSLDLMRLFLGPLADIWANADESTGQLPVEDAVAIHARNARDQVGRADLSWVKAASSPYFLRLEGPLGRIAVGWHEVVLQRGGHAESAVVGPGYDAVAAMGHQLVAMSRVVTGADPVQPGVVDAAANVEGLAAAYRALETGCWQSLAGEETCATGNASVD